MESAFPRLLKSKAGEDTILHEGTDGITMLDYYAARAMQAMLMSPSPNSASYSFIASRAFVVAATMLEERQRLMAKINEKGN